jgi:hypothetical protein
VFTALVAIFFGHQWASPVPADWLAAAFALAGALALMFSLRWKGASRYAAGAGLFAAIVLCFALYAGPSGGLAGGGLTLWIGAGIAFAAGGAGLYLGLPESAHETDWAAVILLVAACLAGASVAALWGRPDDQGLADVLGRELTSWTGSGGPWRWGGVLALFIAYGVVSLSGPAPPWRKPSG